jgi:hypothetical protein
MSKRQRRRGDIVPYILKPGDVFRRYLAAVEVEYDETSFQLGAMYVALEILSHIKLMEEQYIVSEYGRNEAIASLHTLLQSLGLSDETYELYARLIRWRQLKFIDDREPSQPRTADAEQPDEPRGPRSASAPAFPDGWPSRLGTPDPWPVARRDLDGDSWPTREGGE